MPLLRYFSLSISETSFPSLTAFIHYDEILNEIERRINQQLEIQLSENVIQSENTRSTFQQENNTLTLMCNTLNCQSQQTTNNTLDLVDSNTKNEYNLSAGDGGSGKLLQACQIRFLFFN